MDRDVDGSRTFQEFQDFEHTEDFQGMERRMWVLARAVGATALVLAMLTAAVAAASAPTHAPADDPAATGHPAARHPAPRQAGAGDGPRSDVEEYVALGDSYTAGPMIARLLPALGCFRSTHNYPRMLARRLRVERFTDVSCSGADTTHLTTPQDTGFATVPPQLDALSPDTDLVTLGIGGNDFSVFGRLVGVCPALRAQDPDGDPCRDHFATPRGDALLRAVGRVRDRVSDAVAEVGERAPRAEVLVVGYPRIAPRHGTCPAVLPFADGDYRYADTVERRLNAALRHAARANDVAYVDTYRASRGHDACAGAQAWVNGQTTQVGRAQSYHPFRSYMRAVADLAVAELRR